MFLTSIATIYRITPPCALPDKRREWTSTKEQDERKIKRKNSRDAATTYKPNHLIRRKRGLAWPFARKTKIECLHSSDWNSWICIRILCWDLTPGLGQTDDPSIYQSLHLGFALECAVKKGGQNVGMFTLLKSFVLNQEWLMLNIKRQS